MTRSVMVWGTSSGAGKSWLATALCRWAARQGVVVRPFKAQNMSNNARVVAGLDGSLGEIGSAQYFQALAARVVPTVDMNPVLLKPESETSSQVVVHGRVDRELSRLPWRERSARLAVAARESFERVAAGCDLVLIEGAGSPAEINLAADDYVNLGTARWARERGGFGALLVTDIDRGGAFAHVHGTWALLPEDLRPALQGYVLNRFRGDAALLAPGPAQLFALTGVPLAGVIPLMRDHGLPEEDGLHAQAAAPADALRLRIAVVCAPHISNLDEFQPLLQVPGVRLTWARSVAELDGADWIVLPGSKQVSGDLAWLRTTGIAEAVQRHAAAGRAVLGICGGLQMLGDRLVDPDGHDGAAGVDVAGLGLLPIVTHYAPDKLVRRCRFQLVKLDGPWVEWRDVAAEGYEIHCGVVAGRARTVMVDDTGQPLGWQAGSVLGVHVHGLFESPTLIRAMFGHAAPTIEDAFERLADAVDAHLDRRLLGRLLLGL